MKSGFIAIIGPPNAGKSSLTNALVGQKVTIVSPKAQTTRDRVMGIYTDDQHQMIFVDTPGVFKSRNRLDQHMQKSIKNATKDCDAIVVVLDASKGLLDKNIEFIQNHLSIAPLFVALNKVDLVPFDKVYPILKKLTDIFCLEDKHKNFKEIIATSAKSGKNIDVLKKYLTSCLIDEVMYFDSEDVSDKSLDFLAAETIREKTLWLLQDEIPHGIGVFIQSIQQHSKFLEINADIIAEKQSHKEIIIGQNGDMLKNIGTKARLELENLLGKKIFLKLFVKVRKNWRNSRSIIDDLGYKD